MAQNNDPLFQSSKQFLKASATQQPLSAGAFPQQGLDEPVQQTRPSYADVASIQNVGPSAMRTAPSMGDFSDEKLLEMMKAPLTGEEVAAKIADLNANGVDISSDTISREEFIAYDDWRQNQHFNFWGAVGDGMVQAGKEIGGGVVSAATDWKKVGLATGLGFLATPVVGIGVAFGSSLVEGFARGTRDLGGLAVMAANHPDSPIYRMFVNPSGDKDVAYQDFLDLASWNAQSEKILAGKTNAFMPEKQTYEKLFGKQFGDTIDDFIGVNKELSTAASYVLDPTTFMTFGGGAAAKTVATKAAAAAIKTGHAGSAVGHAVAATAARNAAKATFLNSFGETMIKVSNFTTKPIDAMFDAVTGGMERLTGVKHNVSPVNGEVRAQRVHAGHGGERGPRSLTHSLMGIGGVYSAFSIPYALPITSVYAGLKGIKYIGEGLVDIGTKGAKNADSIVGNAIRGSSPIGIYMSDLAKTTIHGGIYGGAIGYATAGEEGAAGGIGTGVTIGAIGHNVGYAYGTISGKFAKEALYKEFDGHMETLKGEGELLKRERVQEFIAKITAQHGKDEGLRAISHIMALEKSKNVTVAYMNYDDMVAAVLNDPNMVEETPMQVKMDTLKPIAADAKISPNANQTNTTFRQRKLSPMGQTLADAIKAKSEGGQGWNGMFTTQHPITGEKMTKPYAIFKNGETGKYHIIINTDNVQAVRDAAGNVQMRYGPEGARPEYTMPEGDEQTTVEQNATGEFTPKPKTPYARNEATRAKEHASFLMRSLGSDWDASVKNQDANNAFSDEALKKAGLLELKPEIEKEYKLLQEEQKKLDAENTTEGNKLQEDFKKKDKAHADRVEQLLAEYRKKNNIADDVDISNNLDAQNFIRNDKERLRLEAIKDEASSKNTNRKNKDVKDRLRFEKDVNDRLAFLEQEAPEDRQKIWDSMEEGDKEIAAFKEEIAKEKDPDKKKVMEKQLKKFEKLNEALKERLKAEGIMSSEGGFEARGPNESIETKNLKADYLKADKRWFDALNEFVKEEFQKGAPKDIREAGISGLNDKNLSDAIEAFKKTDEGAKLFKEQESAVSKYTESVKKDEAKTQTKVKSSKLKMNAGLGWSRPATTPMQGPMKPTWAAPVTRVATTAPLGELWHAMNQVYREVNHQQTITNEVRSWLLERAFVNRADTVKFMHEVYRRIGGAARDINAENGNWMKAIDEFEKTGKIENPQVAESFNRFCEELGEAIFIGWEDGKPFDYVLTGGNLGFARSLIDGISDAFYNRALRDATNLGADIRTKEAFVDWFKRSKNSGVRIDPILADTFKDLVRFYNDKNMKNAGLGRTDLVRFTPAMIKEHATIYGYEQRLQYGANGDVTGLKPLLQYNQEMHMAGKAMIQELAELAELDEAALNGLDFYIYNDGDDVDLAMNGMNGTLDTIGKNGKGFLFQSPDYKGMGVGLDDIVNAQKAKAPTDGIYAPRDAKIWGKRGRARTAPSGRMGADMKEALAKGQHVVFRGIPTEKAFKIIEKYVPKSVSDNVRMLAPLIADGGFSMANVVNGKYNGFTQATRDGVILSKEWGDSFSPRDVTFVPYDMQFKVTLKDLKNPNKDYKQPHFRFNVRSVDIDVLNRRGTILWNNSPEIQGLYKGLHEFKADIFKTMDEYSGSGEIPATDFFGVDDDARLRRKHVVAAIGASPNLAAELQFSAAEAEWHSYQKRDRGAEQNNPWFWMHADGLSGLHVVEGESMRMRMNEKGYYRAMVPTPTHEGAVDSFGNPMMEQMYQSPDEILSVDRDAETTALNKRLININEQLIGLKGMRRYSPEATRLLQTKREIQAKLDFLEGKDGVVDEQGSRQMYQSPDELADLNYDALYGKDMGPNGKRNMFASKQNMTPTLAGTRYDMAGEAWNAGFVGKWGTQNGGKWSYVSGKNGVKKAGNVVGHTTAFKIRRMSEGKGKYRLEVSIQFLDKKGREYGAIGGDLSPDRKSIEHISVYADGKYQGKGYGNMMYSELLERMRAIGVENLDGEVINPEGRPAGVRDNMFGTGNTYIMGKDWDTEIQVATDAEVVRRLERKIDLGEMHGGVRLRSKINKSAFYQSPDAPIKMDIESMRSFHAETSDKPYDANRVAEGLDDPIALLKRLSKLEIFKKKSVRGDYGYAETWGAKDDADAGFLASNFKYAAEKGDVFQSDALKRFVEQTTGSKDVPVLRHTLEEFVSSTNAGVDAYNHSFKTGSPVAFVATHGTVSPKLGGGDHRRNIPSLKPHNHFNGQQATSYAYSYGGPEFANGANAFPEGSQIRAAVGMQNPLVYNFDGEFLRDDIVSTLIDKAKREKRDGIVMLNAIDPRVSSNVKDNHYIIPKGNEHQIAVIDNSFGKKPNPRGLAGAEGSKMFQNPDEGVTLPKGIFGPNNPETVKIGRSILEKKGIPHAGGSFIVRLNPEKSFKIGMAYDSMKHEPFNPLVRKAYEAMAKETLEQYQAIVDAGYKTEMHYEQEEPYGNSRDAIKDIRENKRLKVLATDLNFGDRTVKDSDIKENPLLAMSQYKDANGRQMRINDVFRFVHDFFGHSERGNGFGPIGEENAWDVHARMYSPLARRAMTSGTRGQNSWVNFVNESNIEINRKRDLVRRLEAEGRIVEAAEIRKTIGNTRFADQKIGLLPEWASKTDEELTPIEKDIYGIHQSVKGSFGLYQQPDGYEVNIHGPTSEQFSAIGKMAQQANKFGTSVEIKAPQDYSGYELLMAGDGLAQAAISPDGELGSVVRGPKGSARDVDAVIRAALSTGKVKWLNGFDTILPSLYNSYGFEAVARIAFVDEYKPDGWDFNAYAKYNNGRPDVVFMALVGKDPVPYEKNAQHIPMVASYDDAVRAVKERNRNAAQGGMMFQNGDISILNTEERLRYDTNDLRLRYADYVRTVEEKIKSGEIIPTSKGLVLRNWLAANGPKTPDGKPMYTPISIGEKFKVGDTLIDVRDFSQEHRDQVREDIMEKAEARMDRGDGIKFTPEEIAARNRRSKIMRRYEEMKAEATAWFANLSEEKREELFDDFGDVRKAMRKLFKLNKKKELTAGELAKDIEMSKETEASEKALIEEETNNLIEEGVDPKEAKRQAEESAKKRAESINYEIKNLPEDAVEPIEELRYYAEVATRDEVARSLRKADEATVGQEIELSSEKKVKKTKEDVLSDDDYLDLADRIIEYSKNIVKDYDTGSKRTEPKENWRTGGDSPDIEAQPPTIKLTELYKKFRGTEWFTEEGKPLQWRKKDGTIVQSEKKPAGAEAVDPPEIEAMKGELDRALKEIKAVDLNTRGISALVGLMYLWGYRLNPNLLDKGFDPSFLDLDKIMRLTEDMTPEHALRAELAASGSLIHQFEEGARMTSIVGSIPDLVDTTTEVLSTIVRTSEFARGTFGSEKDSVGRTVESKDLMTAKFVEKYYHMLKNQKGSTFGATLDDIFYKDGNDYADDKMRDKKKNFKDTNKRPPSVFEEREMRETLIQEFEDRGGRILINQFFAPEPH
jgi:GNAT superfamily N-acetyltransferase